ncbi:MAG: flagellar biosynthesis protein FlgJ [Alphaproteobacteria bacterium]|nr:MAG: flagellar biosynthesis protein FlgJ [Alphaproteobacteria bacterium]
MDTSPLTAETSLALMQEAQLNQQTADMVRNRERVEESARDFEAVFITEMMKPMFDGIETDGPFGGGKGEEIFRGIMLDEYGKNVASLNTIGIQTQVANKLIEMQSARTAEATQKNQSNANTEVDAKIIDLKLIEK